MWSNFSTNFLFVKGGRDTSVLFEVGFKILLIAFLRTEFVQHPARCTEKESTMSNEQIAPETKGITVKHLGTVDLGPEIEGMTGRQLRMRMVTFEPGGVFGPMHDHKDRPGIVYILPGNDHRPSRRGHYGLWAGSGLARGSKHHPLAREQRDDSSGGDIGRYSQARVSSGPPKDLRKLGLPGAMT